MTPEKIAVNLDSLRGKSPLVHNITNFVVMNNTANALLSIGASPVMAHAVEEVEDMVSISSSLVINMGTLSDRWVEAMILAGTRAKETGKPVVFDPVGVGATKYRNDTAAAILEKCRPSIIRGNASEILALAKEAVNTKGVDSTASSSSAVEASKSLAIETGAVVIVSGETDYITDGTGLYSVKNGSELMPRVTGMGCTASAIVGAFAAVDRDYMTASVSAMAVMGIAGELAAEKSSGPGSMQMHFIDELYSLDRNRIIAHAEFSKEI